MAERATMMSWYDKMVAAGRSKSLTGNVRCGVAAVHEVLGSPALETPMKLEADATPAKLF